MQEGYKQTEIGVIPETWEVKELKGIAPLRRGFDLPYSQMKDGSYPVVFSNGVGAYHAQYMVKGPGVVTGRSGTIGKVHYIEENYWPHNTSLWVTNFCGNHPKYIYYLFNTINWELYNSGSGVPTLNRNDIHDLKCAIPSVDEQEHVAEALSDVDSMIFSLAKLIAKKKAIKQGTMQDLLTGKKRLPGSAGEWKKYKLDDLLKYEQPTKYIVQNTEYSEQGVPVLTAGKSLLLGYTVETEGIYENIPVIIFDDFVTSSKYINFRFKVKSSAMKMLTLKDENMNLKLVFELMQMINFSPVDHQRHWISQYSQFEIKMPSEIKEQSAIASILSDMDNEIEALEQKLAKARQVKQGMMQQLLTGKIRLV